MPGEPTHFEFGVTDAKRAKDFYGPLLGWKFHQMGEGEGGWIETDGTRGGLHEKDPNPGIQVYFHVPEIEAALKTVKALGGIAAEPSPQEPCFGRFAACTDNQGIRFGLHQPG